MSGHISNGRSWSWIGLANLRLQWSKKARAGMPTSPRWTAQTHWACAKHALQGQARQRSGTPPRCLRRRGGGLRITGIAWHALAWHPRRRSARAPDRRQAVASGRRAGCQASDRAAKRVNRHWPTNRGSPQARTARLRILYNRVTPSRPASAVVVDIRAARRSRLWVRRVSLRTKRAGRVLGADRSPKACPAQSGRRSPQQALCPSRHKACPELVNCEPTTSAVGFGQQSPFSRAAAPRRQPSLCVRLATRTQSANEGSVGAAKATQFGKG